MAMATATARWRAGGPGQRLLFLAPLAACMLASQEGQKPCWGDPGAGGTVTAVPTPPRPHFVSSLIGLVQTVGVPGGEPPSREA